MGYFNCGANIVTLKKDNNKYGMCCAWAMQSDYDKILLLIGSQSETGKNIQIGDYIGVSALNNKQTNIALLFGNNHSSEINKFDNDSIYEKSNVLLVKDAKSNLVCKVVNIMDLENTSDLLVYAYVCEEVLKDNKFLSYNDIK